MIENMEKQVKYIYGDAELFLLYDENTYHMLNLPDNYIFRHL